MFIIDIILGILVAILYGVSAFFAKIVANENPALQWIIVNIVGAIFCILFIFKNPEYLSQLKGTILTYGVISAVFVIIGSFIFYYALNNGNASIVVPLSSMSVAITVILAMAFLKETLAFNQLIGIILIVIGILLLSL